MLAPAGPLADVGGVTVVLVTVELWTSGLVVRLAGLRNALTDELDAGFEGTLVSWAAGLKAGDSPRDPPAPRQPGERLHRLPLTISDDARTRYRSRSRSAGWHRH